MATKKAVAKKEEGPVSEVLPDFMQKGSAGTEVLEQKDIELPWLKLLQGTTPGLNENGWRAGNFLHSILEQEVEGPEGMQITPIVALQPRYVLFRPIEQGGGMLARADDGVHWSPPDYEFQVKINKGTKDVTWKTAATVAKSGLDKWGSSDPADPNSGPAADLQYQYICVSPTHPHFGPFVILLQRSGIKAAKRLNALMMSSGVDAYGLVFNVASLWEDKGPNDKKFLWKFSRAGFVANEEEYKKNAGLYEQFKGVDIGIHDEDSSSTADTPGGDVEGTDDGEY
ncbi:MAG: hypothetical protein ACR2QF_15945 [Geminicoccaceae bacterium]